MQYKMSQLRSTEISRECGLLTATLAINANETPFIFIVKGLSLAPVAPLSEFELLE
jgi:hypothetical protein